MYYESITVFQDENFRNREAVILYRKDGVVYRANVYDENEINEHIASFKLQSGAMVDLDGKIQYRRMYDYSTYRENLFKNQNISHGFSNSYYSDLNNLSSPRSLDRRSINRSHKPYQAAKKMGVKITSVGLAAFLAISGAVNVINKNFVIPESASLKVVSSNILTRNIYDVQVFQGYEEFDSTFKKMVANDYSDLEMQDIQGFVDYLNSVYVANLDHLANASSSKQMLYDTNFSDYYSYLGDDFRIIREFDEKYDRIVGMLKRPSADDIRNNKTFQNVVFEYCSDVCNFILNLNDTGYSRFHVVDDIYDNSISIPTKLVLLTQARSVIDAFDYNHYNNKRMLNEMSKEDLLEKIDSLINQFQKALESNCNKKSM